MVKLPDKTPTKKFCKNRLTGAVGSWFKSRQEMTLKARLVWWSNFQGRSMVALAQ